MSMIYSLAAGISLAIGVITSEPLYIIASALFEIACTLRKEQGE